MLTVSEDARKELEAYFAGRDRKPIRVFLAPGGCSGPRLALALDEPLDSDDVIEEAGFRFCIDKELLAQVKGVSIGISYMGFTLDPEVPLASSGDSGSCGSCTSCGTH